MEARLKSRDCGDVQISKLQTEIDREAENRSELARRAQAAGDRKLKSLIETKMEKSDQKLDSMTVLMLHYCAGLQHCLDQEEMWRLRELEEEKRSREDGDGRCVNEDGDETCGDSVVECTVSETAASSGELDSTVTASDMSDRTERTELDDEELPATDADATAAELMSGVDVATGASIASDDDDDDDDGGGGGDELLMSADGLQCQMQNEPGLVESNSSLSDVVKSEQNVDADELEASLAQPCHRASDSSSHADRNNLY